MVKYAIPIFNGFKIIVGLEEIQQLQENLAEFQIERNESNYPLNSVCNTMLNNWIKETDYDLCFIREGIKKIGLDMTKGLGIEPL